MRSLLIPAAATLVLVAAAQERVFRVDVRLVRLLATVKDTNGKPVGGLDREQFTVYDNGARQALSVFERHTEQPLSVALLVDISGSTAKDLKYELDSVTRFLRALFREGNPEDALGLYSFNWEVRQRTGFTRSLSRLEKELKQLKAEAGTSLYDALYFASEDLQEREGRHVVVAVTDGGDTVSEKGFHDALEALHRGDAVFYAILVMPITNDPGRNVGGENALASFAAGTGGRVFHPSIGAGLDAAFEEILRDLRTQYLLGFYPKDVPLTADRFHRIRVEVARPGLRVITRSGYYGEFDSSAR
ncbi:MAG: VWA domain-containing protein [Acidobacteria bacterium]|nr:VWA domain-containing protein [Acidobacteriota bacterium]